MQNYVDLISGLALQARGLASKGDSPEQLKQACREFESIFVEQLLRSMKATVPQGGFINKSSATKMFEEMLDQQFARETAVSGQLGIAETLYRQMAAAIPSVNAQTDPSEDPKIAK
jgi:peptidoglycan hydrolase FlgJ